MTDDEEMLEFDGEVCHQTERAWLFQIEDSDAETWFPKSQCELSADASTMRCPRWLARLKDLA